MADPKQFSSGSLSQDNTRRTASPIGAPHGQPEGSRVVEDAKEMGTELIGAVREGANSFFEEQRDRVAKEIASVGETLRHCAQSLDRSTSVGRYAENAADEITQFAARLRNRSLGMMADDVEDFARQFPAAFMAAAVGVGFLAGRFLISSASQPRSQAMAQPASRPMPSAHQPVGGARHDYGAVGGSLPSGNAGYGGTGIREPR